MLDLASSTLHKTQYGRDMWHAWERREMPTEFRLDDLKNRLGRRWNE